MDGALGSVTAVLGIVLELNSDHLLLIFGLKKAAIKNLGTFS